MTGHCRALRDRRGGNISLSGAQAVLKEIWTPLSPWAGHILCGSVSGNSSFSELSHSRAMGWVWVCVLGRAGPALVLLW